MRRTLILTLTFLLLFAALLVACNQPEPAPTAKLEPTVERTAPPEPTAEPTRSRNREPTPEPNQHRPMLRLNRRTRST